MFYCSWVINNIYRILGFLSMINLHSAAAATAAGMAAAAPSMTHTINTRVITPSTTATIKTATTTDNIDNNNYNSRKNNKNKKKTILQHFATTWCVYTTVCTSNHTETINWRIQIKKHPPTFMIPHSTITVLVMIIQMRAQLFGLKKWGFHSEIDLLPSHVGVAFCHYYHIMELGPCHAELWNKLFVAASLENASRTLAKQDLRGAWPIFQVEPTS